MSPCLKVDSNSKMVPEEYEIKDKVLLGLGPFSSTPTTQSLDMAFAYEPHPSYPCITPAFVQSPREETLVS